RKKLRIGRACGSAQFGQACPVRGLERLNYPPGRMTGIGQLHCGVDHVAAAPVSNYAVSRTPDPGSKLRDRVLRIFGLELGPNRPRVIRYPLKARNDQIVLRPEMAVERHLVGAGRFGDRVNAYATDAVLMEEAACCGDDAVARPCSHFGTI